MTITVYGSSDDLIEVEGDIREEFAALDGYTEEDDEGGLLAFSDGTVLRVGFSPAGIWRITPVVLPKPEALTVALAVEGDDDNYSDRATLDADVSWVVYGLRIEHA